MNRKNIFCRAFFLIFLEIALALALYFRNSLVLSVQHSTILNKREVVIGETTIKVPNDWLIGAVFKNGRASVYPIFGGKLINHLYSSNEGMAFIVNSGVSKGSSIYVYKLPEKVAKDILGILRSQKAPANFPYSQQKWDNSTVLVTKHNGYWVYSPKYHLNFHVEQLNQLNALKVIPQAHKKEATD